MFFLLLVGISTFRSQNYPIIKYCTSLIHNESKIFWQLLASVTIPSPCHFLNYCIVSIIFKDNVWRSIRIYWLIILEFSSPLIWSWEIFTSLKEKLTIFGFSVGENRICCTNFYQKNKTVKIHACRVEKKRLWDRP